MVNAVQSRGLEVTVTDLFCGAGGSSQGAVKGGAVVRMAINHWRLAVATHQANFRETDHDCADISQCNPRRYPRTNVLIASPECTNHASSKGVARARQQVGLWGEQPDPSAERSRATMWDVPRFAERHAYELVIVENVVDAHKWILWSAWIQAMTALGYAHRCVSFNSMFAYPTPQSRDRLYVVFWRQGNTAPDLEIHPRAWCPRCAQDVDSVQSWKPGRTFGCYKRQYEYCCPSCGQVIEPYYYAAATAIDWSLPVQRIGDRSRPLASATLGRIQAGLDRFAAGRYQPSPAALFDHATPAWVCEALAAIVGREEGATSRAQTALPFTFSQGAWDHVYRSVDAALPAQTSSHEERGNYLTLPFVMQAPHSGENAGRFRLVDDALPTQHTSNAMGIVTAPENAPPAALRTAPYMVYMRNHSTPHDISAPLLTVEAGANHHLLVAPNAPHVPPPFTVAYNGTDAGAHALDDALGAQPTHDRHGLVTPVTPVTRDMAIALDDCGYRILAPHEVQRAMAFALDYVVLGTNRDKVRQLGNAVTPPVMELLIERCLATLRG